MCESRAYLATDGEVEELVLDDVVSIRPEAEGFELVDLYGQRLHLRARLREIDLLKHRIVLEPIP